MNQLLILKCFESATKWLYPKHVSDFVQVRIKMDKLEVFKSASSLVLVTDEYLERLEGKNKYLLFYFKIGILK